jgi:hypothetical protein
MENTSRRDFIKQLGAFAAIALGGKSAVASELFETAEPFDFLVVGDSLIWGQGLEEKQKFYYLTKNWLETEVFEDRREVKLRVKAHSGARLNLRPFEIEALEKAEIGEDEFFHREINLSFPSSRMQLDVARAEYKNARAVDLIMLSGGITDVGVRTILTPSNDNDELRREIIKYCNEEMFKLLAHAAAEFPNALIAVVGYYPFLSKYTPASRIINGALEMQEFPRALKPLINNRASRPLLARYRKKMIERSMIWAENSTLEFKKTVDRLNADFECPRAVFIESPIKAENSIGAKKPMLYDVGKKGKAQDAMAAERLKVCKKTLDELREQTNLTFRARTCEIATVGHPNPQGSLAYAEAIQNALKPFFSSVSG